MLFTAKGILVSYRLSQALSLNPSAKPRRAGLSKSIGILRYSSCFIAVSTVAASDIPPRRFSGTKHKYSFTNAQYLALCSTGP